MKRQRNVDPTNSKVPLKFEDSVAGKRGKIRGVEKAKEEVATAADDVAKAAAAATAAVVAESGVLGWEENWWPWWSGVVVDEQMSWGSIWLPFWDVEFMGEESSYSLFSDVVWDDDIWGIRGIKEVPPP